MPVLLLLRMVEARSAWLEHIDVGVATYLHEWALQRPGAVAALRVGQDVLSPHVFRAACALAALALWRAGSKRLAAWVLVTVGAGALLGVVLKEVAQRARPFFPDPVSVAASYSFPSVHALSSALGVGVLLVAARPALGPVGRAVASAVGAALVLLTGFDRVALGVHYASDVLAGWFAAGALLVGTATAFGAWRGHRRAAAPSSTRTAGSTQRWPALRSTGERRAGAGGTRSAPCRLPHDCWGGSRLRSPCSTPSCSHSAC